MKMNTSNGTDEESCLYSSAGTLAFVRAFFVLGKHQRNGVLNSKLQDRKKRIFY